MAPGGWRDLPDDIKGLMKAAHARAETLANNMAGWRDELWKWHDLSLKLDLGLPSIGHKIRTYTTSDLYSRGLVAPPIARVVGPDDRGSALRSFELPAIVLTLDAPDNEIRAQFEAALDVARKRFPVAFEKSGRKGSDKDSDRALPWPETFDRWRNHYILPWAEFIAWRSSFGTDGFKRYPDVRFSDWRERNRSTIPETKRVLEEAVSNLPRLHHLLWRAGRNLDEAEESTARKWAAAYEAEERAKAADPDS